MMFVLTAMLMLPGCKDGDMAAILDHIHGGATVAVDPLTGAITPSVSVNIKDANGRILFRAEGGVPVDKNMARRLMARGAHHFDVAAPTNRYVFETATRSVDNPCGGSRVVTYRAAEDPLAEVVDISVTPSMREQLRNMILFRDRRYIRNSRPVERVIERTTKYAECLPDINQPINTSFTTTETNTAPNSSPTADPTFPDIAPTEAKKVSSLNVRVSALEGQVATLLQMASRIESKLNQR